MSNLKAFEKFLQGYKTYCIALATAVFGVLYTGFHTHQWSTFGGAWDYVFSAAGLAAIRAALATHTSAVVDAIFASSNASTIVPTPTVIPTVQSAATNESHTPSTPPLIPVG
jgi:hypothetical protein